MVLVLLGLGVAIAWPWRGTNTFWLIAASGALVVSTGVLGFFVGDEIKRLHRRQFRMRASTAALAVSFVGLAAAHVLLLAPMAESAPGVPFPQLSLLLFVVAIGATVVDRSHR